MDRTGSRLNPIAVSGIVFLLMVVGLVAGCGYMPRTGNQMEASLVARDQALRNDMNTNKQELLTRFEEADSRLAAIDSRLADLTATMDEMKNLEVTMQSVRADMTAVTDDLRQVREALRASVRKELGDALIDAGRNLQTGP